MYELQQTMLLGTALVLFGILVFGLLRILYVSGRAGFWMMTGVTAFLLLAYIVGTIARYGFGM